MPLLLRKFLLQPLLCRNIFAFVTLTLLFCATAQAQTPAIINPRLEALERQCTHADTAAQCRQSLPACTQAESILQQGSATRVRDLALARIWNQLVECGLYLGQFTDPHAQQALTLREKVLGAEHPEVAESLNNLALQYKLQGRPAEAEPLYLRSLRIREKVLGRDHPDTETSLFNLANLYYMQGRYVEAEPLFLRSLRSAERTHGPDHAAVATPLNSLAAMYQSQGRSQEAEPLLLRGLHIREKTLGPEHVYVAFSLYNLALLHSSQGRYAEAVAISQRSLSIAEKALGSNHPDIATLSDNLALQYDALGHYAEAEPLFLRSLSIAEKALGPEHVNVATTIHNLAWFYDKQGRDREAEPLYRRSLLISEKTLGADHPNVATTLHSLANLYNEQGLYTKSEPVFLKSLHAAEKSLGSGHPYVSRILSGLAKLYFAQGNIRAMISVLERSVQLCESQLRETVSETRTQSLLALMRIQEDFIYGLLLSELRSPSIQKLTLITALLRKGRAADAGASANRLLHRNFTDPTVQKRFSDWQSVRQKRETLLYGGPGKLHPMDYQAQLAELQLQAEFHEAQLAQAIPQLRTLPLPSFAEIVPAVAKRIPPDGILVEVVWTRLYQPTARDDASRWGTPHLIALLLTRDQHIDSIDLGETATVDQKARELLSALRAPGVDPAPSAQALYQQIVAPLSARLVGKRDVFLSLDGSLHLIPFDALHDGHDYLLGRYRFHYLTSGRDLLRQPAQGPAGPALILANPDFGTVAPREQGSANDFYQHFQELPPLPAAQREAEQVALLVGVRPLLGAAAREEAVHAAHSPWLLHLATHGFFMRDIALPVSKDDRSALITLVHPKPATPADQQNQPADQLPGEAGAMNRSALVLAAVRQGAHASSLEADGLLTAENSRSLDLEGTQLVTLSACETGQGTLSAGQGVYGLRRAFLVAGAETLVTSLWRVHDEATGELMTMYYRKLLDRQRPGDRLTAMIESMQELRSRAGRAHPYYWAPFLVIGQDGPLRRPSLGGERAR